MPTVTRSRTFSPRPRDIERRWYVVDAEGAVLGRLASEVAKILRGKHKPIFAPHMDTGDHVIVVNARGVRLTAGKESAKMLVRHSGYPGGLRTVSYTKVLAEQPATAVERAVRGMLPKNRLGRQMLKKLAVYEGPEHPHEAQKPADLSLGAIPAWEGLPEQAPAPQPKPKPPTKPSKVPAKGGKAVAARGTGRTGGSASGSRRSAGASKSGGSATATRRGGRKAAADRGAAAPPTGAGAKQTRGRRSRAPSSGNKES